MHQFIYISTIDQLFNDRQLSSRPCFLFGEKKKNALQLGCACFERGSKKAPVFLFLLFYFIFLIIFFTHIHSSGNNLIASFVAVRAWCLLRPTINVG